MAEKNRSQENYLDFLKLKEELMWFPNMHFHYHEWIFSDSINDKTFKLYLKITMKFNRELKIEYNTNWEGTDQLKIDFEDQNIHYDGLDKSFLVPLKRWLIDNFQKDELEPLSGIRKGGKYNV